MAALESGGSSDNVGTPSKVRPSWDKWTGSASKISKESIKISKTESSKDVEALQDGQNQLAQTINQIIQRLNLVETTGQSSTGLTPVLATIENKFDLVESRLRENETQREVYSQEVRTIKALYDEVIKKLEYIEAHGLSGWEAEITNLKWMINLEVNSIKEFLNSELAGVQEINSKHFSAMLTDVNGLSTRIDSLEQSGQATSLHIAKVEKDIQIIRETEEMLQKQQV